MVRRKVEIMCEKNKETNNGERKKNNLDNESIPLHKIKLFLPKLHQ